MIPLPGQQLSHQFFGFNGFGPVGRESQKNPRVALKTGFM
jgi:hypothetical protein